jgi:hypothetical protein
MPFFRKSKHTTKQTTHFTTFAVSKLATSQLTNRAAFKITVLPTYFSTCQYPY